MRSGLSGSGGGPHTSLAVAHAGDWERIIAVLAWFQEHPRPGLYLRQLDLPGIDTKFIEVRRGLLAELLDQVLPADAVDVQFSGVGGFDRRYGLRTKPPLVRFRLLDRRLALSGLTDLTVSVAEFARLDLAVARVYVTENEINGLAFPDVTASLVIFGLGYALDRLAEIPWLRDEPLHYWGDIDTHGFAILDRLRAGFPAARSLVMDRAALMAHRALWVQEGDRYVLPLARLTEAEQALFDDLRHDRLGARVRLEQERISYGWVERALREAGGG